MNSEKLAKYLNNQLPLNKEALVEFQQLVKDYPYFQTAHLFLLKILFHLKDKSYKEQLEFSSCFISNKYKLFHFVNSKLPEIKPDENDAKKDAAKKVVKTAVPSSFVKPPKPKVEKLGVKKTGKSLKTANLSVKMPPKMSEEEASKLNYENAIKKHKDIVADFLTDLSDKDILCHPDCESADEKVLGSTKIQSVSITEKYAELNKLTKKYADKTANDYAKKSPFVIKKSSDKPKIDKKEVEKPVAEQQVKNEEKIQPVAPTNSLKTENEVKKLEAPAVKKEVSNGQPKKMNDIFSKIKKIKKDIESTDTSKKADVIDFSKISENEHTGTKSDEKIEELNFAAKDIFENHLKEQQRIENEKQLQAAKLRKLKEKQNAEKQNKNIVTNKDNTDDVDSKNLQKTNVPTKKNDNKNDEPKLSTSHTEINVKKEEKQEKKSNLETKPVTEERVSTKDNTKLETLKKEIVADNKVIKPEADKKSVEQKKELSAADKLLLRIKARKEKMSKAEDNEEEVSENSSVNTDVVAADTDKNAVKTDNREFTPPIENSNNDKPEINDTSSNDARDIEAVVDEEKLILDDSDITEFVLDEKPKKEPVANTKKTKKDRKNLIDSFIAKSEKLERISEKESLLKGDVSVASTYESDDIMTEAYADLLIQQHKYAKAKEVFEKLILKYPKKKTYFAIQIKKIESLI